MVEDAFAALDRLAGPVADVLVQPGQHVEQGRFPHVGLPGQGNQGCTGHHLHDRHADIVTFAHLPLRRTMILAASPRPRATRVPRTVTISGPKP